MREAREDDERGTQGPSRAVFQQGTWHYWESEPRRGRKDRGRLYPEHRYTRAQRDSEAFRALRAAYLRENPGVVALVEELLRRGY